MSNQSKIVIFSNMTFGMLLFSLLKVCIVLTFGMLLGLKLMHVPTDHFKTSYLRLRQEVPVINHIEALNHFASNRIDVKTFG